ncbi:MAG: hypothetical protein DRJ05_14605 [Bacteroidetes bacterium]|nr:MAG: hypothetical protein DRJ05_14605 [Bacteroidota bacterium]
MQTAIENRKAENYFQFMRNWDNESKKYLIIKLTQSIGIETEKDRNFSSCFGAWVDDRTADEIIEDLHADRVNNQEIEEF